MSDKVDKCINMPIYAYVCVLLKPVVFTLVFPCDEMYSHLTSPFSRTDNNKFLCKHLLLLSYLTTITALLVLCLP